VVIPSRHEGTLSKPSHVHGGRGVERLTSEQLLEAYVAQGDEHAFEAIVVRHGPRVLGACRKVLGRSAEVEDVFQSTFLVLATKAGSLRNREFLGPWLCSVAHRLAVRSKVRATKRIARERQAIPVTVPPSEDDLDLQQLRLVLHSEIDRLPDRFRHPVLLCYQEGRTNEEAARLIGCPLGTLKARLYKGREILRGRLARRGIALTVALLLLLLPGEASAEEVPPWLIDATVEVARSRMGRRPLGPAPTAIRASRVAAAVAGVSMLIASTFAWALFQPSPPRGTWMRWLFDLAHKVCQ
jgi:RNA polymerase sigma factor (sigma-70 family)